MLWVSVIEGDDTTLDRIFLTDGSQIFGTVLGASKGQVEIRTEFSGILMISADQIESLYSGQSLVLQLRDGRLLKAQPISIAHRNFVVTTAGVDHTTYSVSDIKSLNPEPWMPGQGFKWSGFVSFSWDIESGNTDKNELDCLLDTQWRKGSTRWILKGEGELDNVSKEKNTDNWTLMGKSDHFLTDTRYWGTACRSGTLALAQWDLGEVAINWRIGQISQVSRNRCAQHEFKESVKKYDVEQ